MPERVRLYRDDDHQPDLIDQTVAVPAGRTLGYLDLEIHVTDADHHRWRAKVRGSDYLVWGLNHQKVIVEFASGERRRAVVRATGDVVGLGAPPALGAKSEPC